jgi:hypothetical protein
MTDLRDAARQALEALKYSTPIPQNKLGHEAAITALRAALEQPEQDNFPEEKLQAVAEYFGDKYHVWYGIGARDVEEVLRQSVRRGLVTLNFDTGEQPEQEPVAWMDPNSGEVCRAHWLESHAPERDVDRFSCPLYTHPPRREWRSLSEEEIESLWRKWVGTQRPNYSFTRAVEAALRS